MILTMKQTETVANKERQFIEYQLFDKILIKAFRAQNPPLFQFGQLQVNFNAQLTGGTNINVQAQINPVCPAGFIENKMSYEKVLEDGSKLSYSKQEFRYYLDNNCIGLLRFCTKKHKGGLFSFTKTYNYYEMQFRNNFYKIYEIRSRNTGINCVVYQNEKMVACIERNLKVENYLEHYVIYAEDNVDIDAIFLIACHFDYCDPDEPKFPLSTVVNIKNGCSVVEYRKELLSKYDPNFKKRLLEEFIAKEEAERNNKQ